jgi:hypothetical protein
MGLFASSPATMDAHILVTGFGERKRDGVETMVTRLGSERGWGRGELAAAMSNFRSVANVLAPLLFGYTYAFGLRQRPSRPTLLFLVRMLVCAVLPEVAFRMADERERRRLAGGANKAE